MPYRPLRTISGKGSGPAQFREALRGLALDAHDLLYAAGDSEVKIFDTNGTLVRRWGTARPPYSVATSSDGRVWVGQSGQIEVFDGSGTLLRTWQDSAHLGRVTAIGFIDDTVLVGDPAGRCIHRFDAAGTLLNTIGKDNPLNGLHIPTGIVDFGIDPTGAIHVANPGKHRVDRYSPEGTLLGHLGRFTGPDPSGFSGCCNPTNVAVAGPGLLCVTEKAGPRAKVYDHSGTLLAMIESADFAPTAKNMDVAVDTRGRVYVAEPVKLAIFIFEPTGGA